MQIKEMIDSHELADKMSDADPMGTGLGGVVEFVNPETGNVLLRRRNLVVQRGRTFALEKMYGINAPVNTGYTADLTRTITLFSVGTGGCPANDPFSPIPVQPTDIELRSKVALRTVDPSNSLTDIKPEDIPFYPVFETVGGKKLYKYKKFNEADAQFVVNKSENKIYRRLPIYISELDCRDQKINELALYFCNPKHGNVEMYSRLTFDTESMSSVVNKGLLIYYYTYA